MEIKPIRYDNIVYYPDEFRRHPDDPYGTVYYQASGVQNATKTLLGVVNSDHTIELHAADGLRLTPADLCDISWCCRCR